ncbi:hypothetical protein SDC9_104423 [bioreactor metagenome]|uniref:Uncharacterized protein n=1 Tax=bioreactor metagenome TaxID=1076179 RepID=A0A645AZ49_9ZZZZ
MLVADDVFHNREACRVALCLDHLLIFPVSGAVGGEVVSRRCSGGVHNVLDVPGDRLNGGIALPGPLLGNLLELLEKHLNRAQVRGEPLVKPYIFNDRFLLVGETWKGSLFLWLPAQGQGPEIVPVQPVLFFELESPGVRLEDGLDISV